MSLRNGWNKFILILILGPNLQVIWEEPDKPGSYSSQLVRYCEERWQITSAE